MNIKLRYFAIMGLTIFGGMMSGLEKGHSPLSLVISVIAVMMILLAGVILLDSLENNN